MTDIKQATRDLLEGLEQGRRIITIHYACENFRDVTDRPVAISAIGVTEIEDATGERDAQVFSIANSPADEDVLVREKDMLGRLFEFAKDRPDTFWVHWNMNSAIYGFAPIVARYRYLFHEDPPSVFPSDRLYDLDAIVEARFGGHYASHPKLRSLCSLNTFFMPFFQSGKEEAKAFADGDYGLCERSTAEKAHLIASILTAFRAGTLQTANSVGTLNFADEHLDAVKVVLTLGQRFLYVQRELARRRQGRPVMTIRDEYDAQDLLRALLVIFFDDVRPEDVASQFAGATSRVDFVLPEFELAVELKYTRAGLDAKALGEELLVDRERYAEKKNVRHLVCLVFDHAGLLRNPRGLERDLSRESSTESFPVTVRIYDR